VFDPSSNRFATVPSANRHAIGVFAYGGRVEFPITRHISLRAEYPRPGVRRARMPAPAIVDTPPPFRRGAGLARLSPIQGRMQ
jgi:hypothetical protein